jgi:DNA-binding GntR family transcriptional regulator
MYRQLAETLREQIVGGAYGAGSLLPTERELMAQYDLSRVTVRAAMDMLATQGLLRRHRGKGTFVAPQRVRHDLSVLSGFYDALSAQGMEPASKLGVYRTVDAAEAGDVALPYGKNVFVERTYLVDDEPIAVVRAALHPRASAIDRETAERHPNYAILTNLLSFSVERAEVSIRAALPEPAVAAALGIAENEPVLVLERTSFATDDVVVEKSRFFIRSDRYEFALSLRGGHAVTQSIRAQPSPAAPAKRLGRPADRPQRRTRS